MDSLDLWDAVVLTPEVMDDAVAATTVDRSDLPPDIGAVVALGTGASGIGGALLVGLGEREAGIPVTACHSHRPPRWTGPGTLVFATSFSGDTEETLDAAALAGSAGATVVAVTGGGALGEMAAAAGWPTIPVPSRLRSSRAALSALSVPQLVVLDRAGLVRGIEDQVGEAADLLRQRRVEIVGSGGEAARLARAIGRTLPLVHGPDGLGAAAATRWRTQVNGLAKTPAFSSTYPDLYHDELVGWGLHGDVTRQLLTVLVLRMPREEPTVTRRIDAVSEILREVVAAVHEVRPTSTDPLGAYFELSMIGDVTALYLAAAEGTDPGPTPVVDQLRAG